MYKYVASGGYSGLTSLGTYAVSVNTAKINSGSTVSRYGEEFAVAAGQNYRIIIPTSYSWPINGTNINTTTGQCLYIVAADRQTGTTGAYFVNNYTRTTDSTLGVDYLDFTLTSGSYLCVSYYYGRGSSTSPASNQYSTYVLGVQGEVSNQWVNYNPSEYNNTWGLGSIYQYDAQNDQWTSQ